MKLMLVTIVIVLAGCASASSRPVNGPDGNPGWYAITCKGSQDNCEEEAGNVCPGGYDVANADGGTSGAVAQTWGTTTMVRATYRGHMLIRCKTASSGP